MGATVMLGTLVGLIVVGFALVPRFDSEAREPSSKHRAQWFTAQTSRRK